MVAAAPDVHIRKSATNSTSVGEALSLSGCHLPPLSSASAYTCENLRPHLLGISLPSGAYYVILYYIVLYYVIYYYIVFYNPQLCLCQVVDGELEEDSAHVSRASLTQHFPFDACPPTTKQASHSPCLQRLVEAVTLSKDAMTVAERNSLIKVCCRDHTVMSGAGRGGGGGVGVGRCVLAACCIGDV